MYRIRDGGFFSFGQNRNKFVLRCILTYIFAPYSYLVGLCATWIHRRTLVKKETMSAGSKVKSLNLEKYEHLFYGYLVRD